MSLRVILLTLVFGVCFGVVVGLVWHGVGMWLTWVAATGVPLTAVFNDEQLVHCDVCGKRVKMGYATCHHCGYSRTAAAWSFTVSMAEACHRPPTVDRPARCTVRP